MGEQPTSENSKKIARIVPYILIDKTFFTNLCILAH